jgi:hypothetical protein
LWKEDCRVYCGNYSSGIVGTPLTLAPNALREYLSRYPSSTLFAIAITASDGSSFEGSVKALVNPEFMNFTIDHHAV